MSALKLEPGERVIFASGRGGAAGYNGLVWLGFLLLGMQVFGGCVSLSLLASSSEFHLNGISWMSFAWLALGGYLIARWIGQRRGQSYVITDRRFIARRMLLGPLTVPLSDLAGARRILVQVTRYGTVINEINTHRVVLGVKNGTSKIGPVRDVDELVSLVNGIATGFVDPRLLGDVNGGPSRAEERGDLFFAKKTVTAGAPRGPLFIGPTKVIGFAEVQRPHQEQRMLTIAGAEIDAASVEENMLDLGQSRLCGRAVVMDRSEGALLVEGKELVLASGANRVAFGLDEADAQRALKYVKAIAGQTYRG